ncbi:hypothetical protein E3N88_34717 [Mikania micrantha]|uniref:Uncharacterized protein n=1 Tax=Mikania micrantha TaxID=192012 RepID=A0A5N6LYY5_9ASTR|nr:hypothetical protein E3N88_34717 [Mikania micrantha]
MVEPRNSSNVAAIKLTITLRSAHDLRLVVLCNHDRLLRDFTKNTFQANHTSRRPRHLRDINAWRIHEKDSLCHRNGSRDIIGRSRAGAKGAERNSQGRRRRARLSGGVAGSWAAGVVVTGRDRRGDGRWKRDS